jgi:hypothetical protein
VHVDFASWQHGPAGRQGFAAAERTAPPRSQLAAAVRRAHSGVATMKMRRIIAPVTLVLNGLLVSGRFGTKMDFETVPISPFLI